MVRPSFIKQINDEVDNMTLWDYFVEYTCYNPVSIYLRKVGRFILRMFRWIPVLWKQEEWDFGYIYPILELKIKELRKSISEDTWHTEDCVQEELQQIDSCLEHLYKYQNAYDYIDIPMKEDIIVKDENGHYVHNSSPEIRDACRRVNDFELKHFNAFWDELKQNHQNWWT